ELRLLPRVIHAEAAAWRARCHANGSRSFAVVPREQIAAHGEAGRSPAVVCLRRRHFLQSVRDGRRWPAGFGGLCHCSSAAQYHKNNDQERCISHGGPPKQLAGGNYSAVLCTPEKPEILIPAICARALAPANAGSQDTARSALPSVRTRHTIPYTWARRCWRRFR